MKRRGPRLAIIVILLLGILIFAGVSYLWTTATDIFQPASSPPGKTIPVVIQNGESTADIANDLQSKGLIRNALAFRIWSRIKGLDKSLQAGVYNNLNSSMSISDIIDQLLNAQPDELLVRVLEGSRIEQIAKSIASAGLTKFSQSDFLRYTKHPNQFPDAAKYPILKSIPPGNSMEGILFPDTYFVPVDANARGVLNMILKEFYQKVQQYHLDTQAQQHHLSLYQMVILASIVERETRFTQDSPGIASVYWNRLFIQPNETAGLLQADPTVQYARDSQTGTKSYWTPLNDKPGNIVPQSPWNTYTFKGLPPTPICSPSLASLQAAASPPKTNYFYFLAKNDGHTVFATTYAEFQQDVQKYLNQ